MRFLKRVLVFLLMLCGGVLAFIAAFVFLVLLGAWVFNHYEAFFAGVQNWTPHMGPAGPAPSWVRPTGVVIMCIFTVAGFLTPYWLIRLIRRRLRKP